MKYFGKVLFLALFVFGMTACSDKVVEVNMANIVGNWQLVAHSEGDVDLHVFDESPTTLYLHKDGTYYCEWSGLGGTYSLDWDRITFSNGMGPMREKSAKIVLLTSKKMHLRFTTIETFKYEKQ